MANSHVFISSTTLASAVSSFTISSIPSTYRDLIISFKGDTGGNAYWRLQFNADTTAANYPYVAFNGNASTAGNDYARTWGVASLGNNALMHVMDYSVGDKYKTVISRNNGSGGGSTEFGTMLVQHWNSTAAINSLTFQTLGTFPIGTSVNVYGVLA